MKYIALLIISLVFTTIAFAAQKPPYLSIANSSPEWSTTVNYATDKEPHGMITVLPNTVTGMPGFDDGEKVRLIDIVFTNKSGASLPFEDWCPNVSHQKFYDWIVINVSQQNTQIMVNCNTSSR